MKHTISLLAALLCALPALKAADMPVSGDKVAFLGDSITQFGTRDSAGYVNLVMSGLKTLGINAELIPAGIAGNQSDDMAARVDKDVISKKPQWMLLSCGVNDVNDLVRDKPNVPGVKLEDYKKYITEICDKADKAGIKVLIMTATMIYEDPVTLQNRVAKPYNEFLRQLAAERKYVLADVNADMWKICAAKKHHYVNIITCDNIHMNLQGNKMIAKCILKAWGVSDEKMTEIEKVWDDIPGAIKVTVRHQVVVNGTENQMFHKTFSFSVNEYKALKEKAKQTKRNAPRYIYEHLDEFTTPKK